MANETLKFFPHAPNTVQLRYLFVETLLGDGEMGSRGEVGYTLGKNALAPEGSGRTAELVNAAER
ncbi:PsbP-related protein, partial [Scytonema sp. PRP1]|uniref:PsbP-related protein n=1 Tax=Scytonema sp. PRP1 TaxID=3120513 RepID=UPI00300D854A